MTGSVEVVYRGIFQAKSFAVVADTEEELQAFLARYEPTNTDVTVAAAAGSARRSARWRTASPW